MAGVKTFYQRVFLSLLLLTAAAFSCCSRVQAQDPRVEVDELRDQVAQLEAQVDALLELTRFMALQVSDLHFEKSTCSSWMATTDLDTQNTSSLGAGIVAGYSHYTAVAHPEITRGASD